MQAHKKPVHNIRVNGYHLNACANSLWFGKEERKVFGNSQDGSTNLYQINVKRFLISPIRKKIVVLKNSNKFFEERKVD